MMIVFPADSTRSASIWSRRVSSARGTATEREAGIPTVMYTAMAKMYAATRQRGASQQGKAWKRGKGGRTEGGPVEEDGALVPPIELPAEAQGADPHNGMHQGLASR